MEKLVIIWRTCEPHQRGQEATLNAKFMTCRHPATVENTGDKVSPSACKQLCLTDFLILSCKRSAAVIPKV